MIPNTDFLTEKKKEATEVKLTKEEYLKKLRVDYPEYFSLTKYQRKCLCATNYWRIINGLPAIPVPKEDVDYYKYFNENCFKIRELKERINGKPVR